MKNQTIIYKNETKNIMHNKHDESSSSLLDTSDVKKIFKIDHKDIKVAGIFILPLKVLPFF